jgi:methylated-DNA-[protein]-cysteine S-methyltransferase
LAPTLSPDHSPLIAYALASPLGWVGVLESPRGLQATTLPCSSASEALAALGANLDAARIVERPDTPIARQLADYLAGQPGPIAVPLAPYKGTTFERAVWAATCQIPYGQTRSYRWVAEAIARPTAYRAVGQALGRNPLPLVVPCHRVVGSDGRLTGFGGGGLHLKARLLAWERQNAA